MATTSFPAQSGFFDSVNHDRLYNAEQMTYPYHRLVSDGVYQDTDGTPSEDLEVVPGGGMSVFVKAGEGMFLGRWFKSPSVIVVSVSANAGLSTRVDSIFVHVDLDARQSTIEYITGGATHPVPTIDGDEAYYRLADISVAPGASTIGSSAITDTRGSDDCPWVTGLIQPVYTISDNEIVDILDDIT